MSYRDRLYSNYSANFGDHKEFDPRIQFAVYDQVYQRLLPEDKKTLIGDLGCGKGEWLAWLKQRGYQNLTGIEVAESEVEFTNDEAITIKTGDVTAVLNDSASLFDLLHAKDVFEHLTKDETIAFLDACMAALKPGGKLWILTFNAQCPLANATRYGDFTHEQGVTPLSLAQVLRATGYEVIRVRGYLPHPASFRGKIRAFLFGAVEKVASLVLKLRHGFNAPNAIIDVNSAMPDLFAIARKPKA